MNVNFGSKDGVIIIEVRGRLESGDALGFEQTVRTGIDEAAHAVIMDCGELVYISSAGLRAVLMTAKNLQKRETPFIVCALPDNVGEVFRISGLDKIIAVQPSRAEALASLDS